MPSCCVEATDAAADGDGNSMGDMISILEGAAAPDAVSGLVLVDAALPPSRTQRIDLAVALRFTVYALPGFGARSIASRRRRLGTRTFVVAGLGDLTEVGLPIPISQLTQFEKKLKGSLFGSSNPRADIPKLLDMYRAGHLRLNELVTTEYALDDIARGYEDMHAGKNIRGVIRFCESVLKLRTALVGT